MGHTNNQKSFLKSKFFFLMMSLVITGIFMRILSPPQKLDVRFYYTLADGIEYLQGLSLDQKRLYFYGELFDFWFMFNYSWIFFLIIKKKIVFIAGLLDFFETFLICYYLFNGEFMAGTWLLPFFSSAKWLFATLTTVAILIILLKKRLKS